MAERQKNKPQGPSTQFRVFRCKCGASHTMNCWFGDWYDLGTDGTPLQCECGAYYKKIDRIPSDAITDSWYEEDA